MSGHSDVQDGVGLWSYGAGRTRSPIVTCAAPRHGRGRYRFAMSNDMSRTVGLGRGSRLAATLWLAGLLLRVALPGDSVAADEKRPPAVLILLPGQPTGTQTSIDSFAAAARASLAGSLPGGSSVYMEYTDLARLGTVADQAKLRDWYHVKYAGSPIDLIIAGGQEPRALLMRFRPELWPGGPVVFGAIIT